jgi:periodic tryptophan protein 1
MRIITRITILNSIIPIKTACRRKMSMITATTWVPRGFAAPFPTKYTFDEEEFKRIAELAKLQLDDANEDLDDARNGVKAALAGSDGEGSDIEDTERPLQSTA